MKRFLTWTAVALWGFSLLLITLLIVASFLAISRIKQQYVVDIPPVSIFVDDETLAHGKHIVSAISGCLECHGKDLGGKAFLDMPLVGTVYATNLTAGKGGIGAFYTDEDWVRALGHGVSANKRMLLFMPSQHSRAYSTRDLNAVIAYMKTVPPVDRETPPPQLSATGLILFGMGAMGTMAAEQIEHNVPPPAAPPPGATADYGQYLVTIGNCQDCHGDDLSGGWITPTWPRAPSIRRSGAIQNWTLDDFVKAMRDGVRPDGTSVDIFMPWYLFGDMTDEELTAIWLYLQAQS